MMTMPHKASRGGKAANRHGREFKFGASIPLSPPKKQEESSLKKNHWLNPPGTAAQPRTGAA